MLILQSIRIRKNLNSRKDKFEFPGDPRFLLKQLPAHLERVMKCGEAAAYVSVWTGVC